MNVLVIGGNHHNTLGVIRSLGYAGVSPYVIISSKERHPYVSYSKFIKKKWIVDNDEDVLRLLLSLQLEKGTIVIACSDSLASLLDQNYDSLSKIYKLPGSPEQGRISYLMDKEVMSDLARDIGFAVPQTFVVTDKKPSVLPSFPFPWIVKPLVSCHGSKQDIKRCYNKGDWETYLNENHCLKVQVQKLIEKEYEFQLIGCSFGGEIILPGVARIIRPSEVSNTGFLKYIPTNILPISEVKCKEFIARTGYSGLFSIEFIHGQDGIDYFMEINFRNDGNSICVTASGLNLPFIWCQHQIDGNMQKELGKKDIMKTVYVMPEFDDIILLLKGKINVLTWLKDIFKTDCFMEFSLKDPEPFLHALYGFLKRAFHYVGKRIL